MRKLCILTLATTLMVTLVQPMHSQEPYYEEAPTYAPQDAYYEDSSAYYGGARAAHWSAYVPIGALIAAAIWMGVADTHHANDGSSYSGHSRSYHSHSAGYSH